MTAAATSLAAPAADAPSQTMAANAAASIPSSASAPVSDPAPPSAAAGGETERDASQPPAENAAPAPSVGAGDNPIGAGADNNSEPSDRPGPGDAAATAPRSNEAQRQAVAAAIGPAPLDVWERIRRGFAIPDLTSKLATNRTQWYVGQPEYIDRMTTRASLYLYHIVEEIEKRHMPTELALLPFVESAMQPEALSYAKAAGLWQFIPSTGKKYALQQNPWRDERRDVIESTRAALDYLQNLYNEFGSWHLALAAYNMGEGGLERAIARNRGNHKATDYSSLRLPRETQYYVPKLQAIKNIVRDPEHYGIALPAISNEPYFVVVNKTRDIDVATAARLAEMPIDEFRALNPSFNRPVIVSAASPNILLPAQHASSFLANLAAFEATGQPLASWTTYTLQQHETLAQVATRAGVSEQSLREANQILPRYRLTSGSTILIPRDETMEDDIAADKLAAFFTLVPEQPNLKQVTYRVRRGETLSSVARHWNVKPAEIVAWNNLRSDVLFAGQRLSLTVVRALGKAVSKPKSSSAGAAHAVAATPLPTRAAIR